MSVDRAVAALRSVGYPLVRRDVAASAGQPGLRVDVVAWAPDGAGELVPQVAVEVEKSGSAKAIPAALRRLAASRDVLGTRRHYLLLGEVWYAANSGLTDAVPAGGPERSPGSGDSRLTDPGLVGQMAARRLFQLADRRRGREDSSKGVLAAAMQLVEEAAELQGIAADDEVIRVPSPVLAESLFDGLPTWVLRSGRKNAESLTEPRVGAALARLLAPRGAGVVLDPFCGSGSMLWHARQAAGADARLTLIGQDADAVIVALARSLGRLVPSGIEVWHGDSLASLLPPADYVITQPPPTLRLQAGYRLQNGQETKDADIAALDLSLRTLRPGGRAVVSTPRNWLWRESAAVYRRWLSEQAHVVALIGLPRGAFAGSGIDSVATVLAAAPPGETFVAQLGLDWKTELSPGGSALRAYREHLGSPS